MTIVFATTTPPTIEEQIRSEFGTSSPIMERIAFCESTMRQYDSSGNVLRGPTDDVGIFQIAPLWRPELEKAGISVSTIEGNIKAAHYVRDKQGFKAWNSSGKCWKP